MKARGLLETEIASLRATAGKVTGEAEEALGGVARNVLSAQAMEEEPGKDKGGGVRGPNASSIESPPSYSRENKDTVTMGSSKRDEASSPSCGALCALPLYSD